MLICLRTGTSSTAVLLKLEQASGSSESLLKHRYLGPTSRVSNLVLPVEPNNLHWNKFPGDADASGLGTSVCDPLAYRYLQRTFQILLDTVNDRFMQKLSSPCKHLNGIHWAEGESLTNYAELLK